MGTVTPNIGLYIPADGETNYGTAFANGMLNLDTHDHSGAPSKGVPLSASGLAPGSVTRDKLNANVLSPGGGLKFDINNAIEVDGYLEELFNLATVNNAFLITDGSGDLAFENTRVKLLTSGVQIKGNPAPVAVPTPSGYVGQKLSASVSSMSGVSVADGIYSEVTSLVVPAGTWLLYGEVGFNGSATTTQIVGTIHTATAALGSKYYSDTGQVVSVLVQSAIMAQVITIDAPTTYYLNAFASFPSGSVTGYGSIEALRIA